MSWKRLYEMFADWQRENGGKPWNKATFKNRVVSHRLFAGMTAGKLRTPEGRVNGLRGVRECRPSDDLEPAATPEVAGDALIAVEDVPELVPHVAPERDEVERREVVAAIDKLVCELYELPGGRDEVDRLVAETGCSGPDAALGVLRAFRMRLDGSLQRMRL